MVISTLNRPNILNHLTAQQIASSLAQAVIIVDNTSQIQYVNMAFTEITGYSPKEVIGRNPRLLQSGKQSRLFYKRMWTSLLDTGHWQGEICNRRKNGSLYTESLAINPIKDNHGRVTHYIGIFSDISRKKRTEEALRHRAFHDPLTNLPNRPFFLAYLDRVLARARRDRAAVAVLFIDLDKMKWVNDTLGHAAGDRVLQETAARLVSCVREADSVARLGGDEFTVVVDDIKDKGDALKVSDKILRSLAVPFIINGRKVNLSASVGVSLYPDHGATVNTLMYRADAAMYRAKTRGGGRLQCFGASHQPFSFAKAS